MLQQEVSQTTVRQTTVRQAKRPRRLITLVLQYALSLLLVFAFILPLLFMVSASFKQSNDAIFSDLQSFRGFLPVGNLYVTAGMRDKSRLLKRSRGHGHARSASAQHLCN